MSTLVATHRTMDELNAGLAHIRQSPRDGGTLEMIVVRPAHDERVMLERCDLSPEGGFHGDDWAALCGLKLPDGRSNPDVQVTIMNARLAGLIAPDRVRWPLAGDQLYADLDLSYENLPVGQRLAIGTAVLEITAELHKGCAKFMARFGNDALKFISNDEGKRLNLRGIYAKIVVPGTVAVGDVIRKV